MRPFKGLKPFLSRSTRAYNQRDFASKVEIAIKQGHGNMGKKPYVPLISVRWGTSGFASRIPDPATGHPLHTLSNAESDIARSFIFHPDHLKAFTQVALLPRDAVMTLAHEMAIDYPVYPDGKTPVLLSADFVAIQRKGDSMKMDVVSVKSSRVGLKDRDWELARLQGAYWAQQATNYKGIEISFAMKFRCDAPKNRIENVRWIENYHRFSKLVSCRDRSVEIEAALYPRVAAGEALNEACLAVQQDMALGRNICMTQVRFFLASRTWVVDLDQEINPFAPLSILERRLANLC